MIVGIQLIKSLRMFKHIFPKNVDINGKMLNGQPI